MTDAPSWKFRRMHAGEMNIDPIESEFFSTEALESSADALVREAIQNSLDARAPGAPARVRIAFSAPGAELRSGGTRDAISRGCGRTLPRTAAGSGLPAQDTPLSFVAIEDFGTRGLQGNPPPERGRGTRPDAPRNDFYYFWRNIGRSRKGDRPRTLGSRQDGLPASSRLNAFFALTARRDDGRRLLMGQAVLRIHKVDGVRYYPYGYFGDFEGDFALPVEDDEWIEAFAPTSASRGRDPGCRWWCRSRSGARSGHAAALGGAAHFVPILGGTWWWRWCDGRREVLDAHSLDRVLARAGGSEGLALGRWWIWRWGLSIGPDRRMRLPEPPATTAPRWAAEGRSRPLSGHCVSLSAAASGWRSKSRCG
jgi:hypothetical protein